MSNRSPNLLQLPHGEATELLLIIVFFFFILFYLTLFFIFDFAILINKEKYLKMVWSK